MSKKNKNSIFIFIEEKDPQKKPAFEEFMQLIQKLELDFFAEKKSLAPSFWVQVKQLERRTGQSFAHWIVRYAQTIDILHLEIFRYLKNFDINLHAVDIEGQSLLHIAALRGFLLLTCWLIETEKLDIDLLSHAGIHPLSFVFLRKHYPENGIEIIPNNLADYYIEALPKFSKDKNSALIVATAEGRDKIIDWLGKHRLNLAVSDVALQDDQKISHIHYRNELGFSAIDIAIIKQKNAALEKLIKFGADPLRLSAEKTSVFHYLAELGDCQLFIKTYQKFAPQLNLLIDSNGNNLLHYATMTNNLELVQFLAKTEFGLLTPEILNNGTLCGITPDNLPIIQWLVEEKGLIVYEETSQGRKPYIYDTHNDLNILHSAICNDNLEAVKWLINTYHFDLNANQKHGLNALHFAVMAPTLKVAKWLHAENLAHVVMNQKGQTPLHLAVLAENYSHAKWLIDEVNIDIFAKDQQKQSILNLIALKPYDESAHHFLKWLIDEKQTLNDFLSSSEYLQWVHQLAKSGFTDLVMDLLHTNKVQLLTFNEEGDNLFDTAVYVGQFSLIIRLIEFIQNLNKTSDYKKISIKKFKSYPEYLTFLASTRLPGSNISILQVNALDADGEATIHELIKYSMPDFFMPFLETFAYLGFDFNIKTTNGDSPLALIIQYHDDETIKAFIQKYNPSMTSLDASQKSIFELILQQTNERHELFEWLLNYVDPTQFPASKQYDVLQISYQKNFAHSFKMVVDFFIQQPKLFQHPLLLALKNDHVNMLKYLLETFDLNLKFRDENKKDLLFLATKNKKMACFNFLKEICLQSDEGLSLLKTALKNKHLKFNDLYSEVITNGNIFALKALIETNLLNWRSNTLFEEAMNKGFSQLINYLILECCALPSDTKCINSLIKNDLHKIKAYHQLWVEYSEHPEVKWINQVLQTYPNGFSDQQLLFMIIHYAPTVLAEKMLMLLNIEHITDQHQNNALHLACSSGRLDLISILLTYPKLSNHKNIFGRTALHTAVAFGFHEIVDLLLQNAEQNLLTIDNNAQNLLHQAVLYGMTPLVISILKQQPQYIFCKDVFGNSPIHALLNAEYIFEENKINIQNMHQKLIQNGFFKLHDLPNIMESPKKTC